MVGEMLKGKHRSYPRNKSLAEVFFKAGYIESWRRGISPVMEACPKAELPEPTIKEVAGGIQITFLKDIFSADYLKQLGLNERQIEAVKYVKKNGRMTNKEYQEPNDVSKRTASRDLSKMVSLNILKSSGVPGAGAFYEISVMGS